MAITFLEEKKRQTYLIWVLAVLVFLILFTVWYSFFRKTEISIPKKTTKPLDVKIDFSVLRDPRLQEFQPFERISLVGGGTTTEEIKGIKLGRDNPFVPFVVKKATGTVTGTKSVK